MTAAEYKAARERIGTMTITNEAVLAIQSLRRPRGVLSTGRAERMLLDWVISIERSYTPTPKPAK